MGPQAEAKGTRGRWRTFQIRPGGLAEGPLRVEPALQGRELLLAARCSEGSRVWAERSPGLLPRWETVPGGFPAALIKASKRPDPRQSDVPFPQREQMEDESVLVSGGPPWPLRCCGDSFPATSPEGAGDIKTMTNVSAGLLTPRRRDTRGEHRGCRKTREVLMPPERTPCLREQPPFPPSARVSEEEGGQQTTHGPLWKTRQHSPAFFPFC